MLDFNYNNRSEIIFGKNSLTKIPSILKKHQVKSLLLIYSGDFIKYLGIWGFIKESCESLNINFSSCGKVVPNPKIELVRDLVNLGKEKSVDFIIAVGGGSSIDTAKAVSIGINYDGEYGISLIKVSFHNHRFQLVQLQLYQRVDRKLQMHQLYQMDF